MFKSVLVVCVGNVCRSPVGERLLAARLMSYGSSISVSSAGIGALIGHSADETATAVAAEHSINLDGHLARQFCHKIGYNHDLILTMEAGHRRVIIAQYPDLSGRVMLFDHWQGGKGIADPYQLSRQFHQEVFSLINTAGSIWAEKLVHPTKGSRNE